MSDPLSIAASVAGLITLTTAMYTSLTSFVDRVETAPRFAQTILMEVSITRMALDTMSNLIDKFASLSPSRRAMVHLDCLIMTVSHAVMTFSDVEVFLSGWPAISRISSSPLQKIRWSLQDDKAQRLIRRMKDARDGISLMLNIFQSESDFGAMQARDMLQLTVNRLLQENRHLRASLLSSRNTGDSGSILSEGANSITSRTRSLINQSRRASLVLNRPFETILNTTRVYSRVENNTCDMSLLTDLVESHLGSTYTGLTLDRISITSVVALPLPVCRVVNKQWYVSQRNSTIAKHRIVVVGERGTGKSALIIRLCDGAFSTNFDPTIEDTYQTTISHEGQVHILQIVDTGGHQDYNMATANLIKTADGVIIVYPINSSGEFSRVGHIHDSIKEILGKDNSAPIVLVGTGMDEELPRTILKARGESLAGQLGCGFFETSAKDGTNVVAPFLYVVGRSRGVEEQTTGSQLLGWESE